MAIVTTFPADNYVPGVGIEFDFFTGARATPASERSMLIVGTRRSTGTVAAETLVEVFDESDADSKFGIGSEVALMVRWAMKVLRALGLATPRIWCVGIDEPGAGTAATGSFTFTGTATASGEAILWIHGVEVRVPIANGDAAATCKTTAIAQINAKERELNLVASDGGTGVVTLTARHKGTNGNDIKIEVRNGSDDRPALPGGIACAASAATLASGAGVIDITNALDKTKQVEVWHIAISNNESADITDLDAHLDEMWATMTDRFRFAHIAEISALATAQSLASSANDERIAVHTYAGARTLPGQIAAGMAAMMAARERPNFNHCGTELPFVGPALGSAYSPTEQNTAIKSGCSALVPLPNGKSRVVRTVTTKTTQDGVTTRVLMDMQVPYTLARIAAEVDVATTLTLQERNIDEPLRKDLQQVALNVLRAREDSGWLKDVDALRDSIRAETHPQNDTRVLLAVPASVVKIAAQAVVKVTNV